MKKESLIRTPNNEVHETLRALQEAGGNRADLQHLRSNPEIARAVIYKIREMADPETSVFHQMARDIMGPNFLGISEAVKHFKIDPTAEQFEALDKIPLSDENLRKFRNTHILVADFGLSIYEIRKLVDKTLFPHEDIIFNSEKFAKEKSKPQWRLICKDLVPNSTSIKWPGNQDKLPLDSAEENSARALVYIIILNYLATGEYMLERVYARTGTLISNGCTVFLGDFGRNGFHFDYSYNCPPP